MCTQSCGGKLSYPWDPLECLSVCIHCGQYQVKGTHVKGRVAKSEFRVIEFNPGKSS